MNNIESDDVQCGQLERMEISDLMLERKKEPSPRWFRFSGSCATCKIPTKDLQLDNNLLDSLESTPLRVGKIGLSDSVLRPATFHY